MALLEGKTPSEQKKTIAALALGAVAFISLAYMFLGSSGTKKQSGNSNKAVAKASPALRNSILKPSDVPDDLSVVRPVVYTLSPPVVPEAGRNIFAFYVPPPKPTPDPNATPKPVPTPTPVPPNVVLAAISPVNVYAHTGDFTLDVMGDKFTPETRIYVQGAELSTRYVSPQQLSAKVPAQLISFEGAREMQVRSRDGQLFSNTATLNVMPAPVPNYSYIGVLTRRGSNDTAILKEKNGKDLLNVQRGDVLGGRFRVTSISVQEVTLTDTTLNIKHKLALLGNGPNQGVGGQPPRYQPPPQPPAEEEETEP
jgi:hypothetical protein